MQNDKNIKEILVQVRKAYRLLYNYQKSVLDLINYIGRYYGFKYNGGYPKFSNAAPNNGGGKLENVSWDWLNLYFYEFNFGYKEIEGDKIHFAIFLMTDSGYFDYNTVDKLDTNSFKSVEDSKSQLIFLVGKNIWEVSQWSNRWNNFDFIFDKELYINEDSNKLMISKHYLLENFETEYKAKEYLEHFLNFCKKEYNIVLK
ncbi:hypothetical protein [Riemerella columbina]|uniref:hypothetical protein n=1 Tax=Riemerella columbina TaxID=103810 RepID=UPI000370369B|nr:hypothetical protein [Riemerella columbina]